MWAVVKIQRAFRKYRLRREARHAAKKKVSNTKERWRKKAEGDQYKPPAPEPPPPPQRRIAPRREASPAPPPPHEMTKEEEEEEYRRRRRTDFMDDVSEENDYVKTFYDNQKNPNGAVGAVYRYKITEKSLDLSLMSFLSYFRRKRFDDLKSVNQRKDEAKQIESWLNM